MHHPELEPRLSAGPRPWVIPPLSMQGITPEDYARGFDRSSAVNSEPPTAGELEADARELRRPPTAEQLACVDRLGITQEDFLP